ncbi:unnamed protein product [Amoebophrya sp. A25]|nr:unnamed protein product [Amoebophrya sp. A25]|eukprot:GSA25T00021537001.1
MPKPLFALWSVAGGPLAAIQGVGAASDGDTAHQSGQMVILPGQENPPEKHRQYQRFRLQYDPYHFSGDHSFPYEHPTTYVADTRERMYNSDVVVGKTEDAPPATSVQQSAEQPEDEQDHERTAERMIPLVAPFMNETYLVATFSASYCSPEKSVESWFQTNESPARHNPLRMISMFNAVGLQKDELGSSCIGYDFQAELCIQSIDLVRAPEHGFPLIWIPTPVVANYRVESLLLPDSALDFVSRMLQERFSNSAKKSKQKIMASLAEESSGSQEAQDTTSSSTAIKNAPTTAQTAAPKSRSLRELRTRTTSNRARSFRTMDEEESKLLLQYMAATASAGTILPQSGDDLAPPSFGEPLDRLEFTMPYIDQAAAWWGKHVYKLEPRESWMGMMSEAIQYVIQAAEIGAKGLWAEFGVASGKSTAYIASVMQKTYGAPAEGAIPHPLLHGFDSFIGIPDAWNNLATGTFTMDGKVPEIVQNMKNILVHKGWFNETKYDLDHEGRVAFLHMDMDIYPAAREILLHFACRLERGTILVFDELINYAGWAYEGEFQALEEVASLRGLIWEPLGFYHEQAVPIMIVENRRLGCPGKVS